MKDLPKRAVTAVLFAIVVLGAILFNRLTFSLLVLIVQTGCLYEYLLLVRKFQSYEPGQNKVPLVITLLIGSSVFISVIITQQSIFTPAYLLLFIPACLLLLSAEIFYRAPSFFNGILNSSAIIYISAPMLLWYSLADDRGLFSESSWYPDQVALPLGVLLIIWSNDTFAYFTGSLLGKHKMMPSVSPKKSWEGFFGGLIFACITGWLLSLYFTSVSPSHWIMIAIIVVAFGTLGDFFESMLKRQAGVKDSGNLLPGHGGLLDRFDALIFCLPFVAVYFHLFAE